LKSFDWNMDGWLFSMIRSTPFIGCSNFHRAFSIFAPWNDEIIVPKDILSSPEEWNDLTARVPGTGWHDIPAVRNNQVISPDEISPSNTPCNHLTWKIWESVKRNDCLTSRHPCETERWIHLTWKHTNLSEQWCGFSEGEKSKWLMNK
jgi:hypothetical protein